MSLKIAVLSSLTALSAFRAHAPADDQAQNLGPVWSQEPLPTTVSRTSSAAESKKPEAGGAATGRPLKIGRSRRIKGLHRKPSGLPRALFSSSTSTAPRADSPSLKE